MGWWGKAIGCTAGLVSSGLDGAALGLILGHGVDWGWRRIKARALGALRLGNQERVQSAFFSATFGVMGHLAKIDGRVSESEIELARAVMSRMELSPEKKREAIRLFTEGKAPDFPLDSVLADFKRTCLRHGNLLRMFLEILFHAAYSDGTLTDAERHLLAHISRQLGVSQLEFMALEAAVRAVRGDFGSHRTRDPAQPSLGPRSLDGDFAVLNLKSNASNGEIKKAYRRLMNQHHPDKLQARGLPDEMVKMAGQKTQQIREAYERVRKARGF